MHWKWKVTGFVTKTNCHNNFRVDSLSVCLWNCRWPGVLTLGLIYVLRLEQECEDSNFFIFLSKFWFFPCPTYAGHKLIALHNLPQFNFDLDLSAIFFSTINRLSHLIISVFLSNLLFQTNFNLPYNNLPSIPLND